MILTSPELGALAELRFQQRCVERGVPCYAPIIGTNKAVDFIIDRDGCLVRIQVKKGKIVEGDERNRCTRFQASTADTRYNKYRERPDHALFDFYAFVCLELNSIWLVPASEVHTVTWSKSVERLPEIASYLF